MKKSLSLFLMVVSLKTISQTNVIKVPENLVVENIPQINNSVVNDVKSYTESRGASFVAWHPTKKEMIITTRFANSNQLHYFRRTILRKSHSAMKSLVQHNTGVLTVG
jgi:hypothetical protein